MTEMPDLKEFVLAAKRSILSWHAIVVLYAFAGCIAAAASFVLELRFMNEILGSLLGLFVTMAFEVSKLCTIVVYEFLKIKKQIFVSGGIKTLTIIFQWLLVLLSVVCSFAMISSAIDEPHLEKIRMAELEQLETDYQKQLATLKEQTVRKHADTQARFTQRKKDIDALYASENQNDAYTKQAQALYEQRLDQAKVSYDLRRKEIAASYDQKIEAARKGMEVQKEIRNKRTGEVVGAKYLAHSKEFDKYTDLKQQELTKAQNDYDERINVILQSHQNVIAINPRIAQKTVNHKEAYDVYVKESSKIDTVNQTAHSHIREQYLAAQAAITTKSYEGDARVQSKVINNTLETLNELIATFESKTTISGAVFVVICAMIVSLLLELSIILSLKAFVSNYTGHMQTVFETEDYRQNVKKNSSDSGSGSSNDSKT